MTRFLRCLLALAFACLPLPSPAEDALPPALVSTAAFLSANGLADPRGGEYRDIIVRVGSVRGGDGGTVKTRGWVLPGNGKKQAVCWNGLATRVETVGPRADLAADVRAAMAADAHLDVDHRQYNRLPKADEATLLDEKTLLPVKICLLWRLGEDSLARALWAAWQSGLRNEERSKDPFLTIAGDWPWAAFDRAVTAHIRGDDEGALINGRLLLAAGPKLEAEAARRGFPQPKSAIGSTPRPYFEYLENVPTLADDSARRLARPKRAPFDEKRLAKQSQAHRIAALIDRLDEVEERQNGQPGGVALGAGRISSALIAEGDAAVEPLLDTLETDTRLTRSVEFGRDFFRRRYLLPVQAAAFDVLVGILHTSEFGADRSARTLRAWWNKNKSLTPPERWLRTLADDAASERQRQEAAATLVERPFAPAPMRGEALRGLKNPSVSALLDKRAREEAAAGGFALADGCRLALMLYEWEPQAALPTLQAVSRRSLEAMATDSGARETVSGTYARVVVARMRLGDKTAAPEYARWLQTRAPGEFGWQANAVLEPFWRTSEDFDLAAAAIHRFDAPKSLWNPLAARLLPPVGDDEPRLAWTRPSEFFQTPVLLSPALRRHVLRALSDTGEVGTVTPEADGYVRFRIGMTDDGYGFVPTEGPDILPMGRPAPLRRCDFYAACLCRGGPPEYPGIPPFEPVWTLPRRDAALARVRDYVLRFGPRLVAVTDYPLFSNLNSPRLRLNFPLLSGPATPDDVASARAVFSLAGEGGEKRVVPLTHPLPARWEKNAPIIGIALGTDPKTGKSRLVPYREYYGDVYQREEVKIGGKWKRFYGFVGHHTFARVPAEDIKIYE